MSEILNAKITSVSLTMADHCCLTYYLGLDMGGTKCSYGGLCIGHGYLGADEFEGSPYGLEAMMRIMDTVGVDRWEDMKGKYCRVVSDGWGSVVHTIGHIIEDKWFDQRKFFEEKANARIKED